MTVASKHLKVSDLVDKAGFSSLQIRVVLLCVLIGFLDGADTQSIGVAARFLAQAASIRIESFGPIFAAAQLGAAFGAMTFGPLADKYGRKPILILAVCLFASFTLATAMASTFPELLIVRFLAGIGLGGAAPCFLSLASDYSPTKHRGTISTLIWSSYPLGAAAGGFLNAYILTHFGWHAIFLLGGALPLIVAVALLMFLPESIQFMAAQGGNDERIRRLVKKMGSLVEQGVQFLPDEKKQSGVPIKHLFMDNRGVITSILLGLFFLAFATTNVMTMWTPTLLQRNGLSPADAAIVLACFNIGAFVGTAAAGRLVDRFGAARTITPLLMLGAVGFVALGFATTRPLAALTAVLIGLTIGTAASGAIALASVTYPARIRSTGIGCGIAAARIGQVVSPLIIGGLLAAGLGSGRIFLVAAIFPILAAMTPIALMLQKKRSGAASLPA